MSVPAAAAGVHGANQHEAAGIDGGACGTGDLYRTVLKGLAQHFKDFFGELGQLVQKENAVVGQRNFTGTGIGTATGHTHGGDGVVGGAEGPLVDEGLHRGSQPHNRMDLGGLQRLLSGHGGEDTGQTAGQHGLARAGAATHEYIVVAGGGNLQSSFDLFLSFDFGEVGAVEGRSARFPLGSGGDEFLAGQMLDQLIHIPDGIDGQTLGQSSLGGVFLGDIESGKALSLGRQRHGQHTCAGAQLAGEGEFSQKDAVGILQL